MLSELKLQSGRPSKIRVIDTETGYHSGCSQKTYFNRLVDIHDLLIEECLARSGPVSILDIGIGAGNSVQPGITVRQLAQRLASVRPGAEVYGLDIDLATLKHRHDGEVDGNGIPFHLLNLTLIEADATQTLGLKPGSIDYILCFNMLKHLEHLDRTRVFEQVYRTLKVGGKFFFLLNFTDGNERPPIVLQKSDESASKDCSSGSVLPASWGAILATMLEQLNVLSYIIPKNKPLGLFFPKTTY